MVDVFSYADLSSSVSMKSVSGMILWMYGNYVFRRSKRQELIAGDTTEGEPTAVSTPANELMWPKRLRIDSSLRAQIPTLRGDN